MGITIVTRLKIKTKESQPWFRKSRKHIISGAATAVKDMVNAAAAISRQMTKQHAENQNKLSAL
jgi:hypothetical protein